ncbi:site-2 protease family protein [Methanocaldococcus indicus]|uniref:site-2 protease family protein n=1 Tax=Methanocaldococcus indicus TaxID=213231 RepID=UPI003C6CE75E
MYSKIILILAIVLWLIMYSIREKINLKVYGGIFGILKTKIGLELIDYLGKFKIWKKIGIYLVPIAGILGFYMLINLIFFIVNLVSGAVPKDSAKPIIFLFGNVIPWIPGLIGITIAITIHELAHGVFAKSYNVNVKSTGLIFLLGFPLGAFVELDDKFKEINKKIRGVIAAAGPMANMLLFIIVMLLLPISYNLPAEIKVVKTDYNAKNFLKKGDIIYQIGNIKINNLEDFKKAAKTLEPNKEYIVKVIRDGKIFEYNIKTNDKGKLGIYVTVSGWISYLVNTLYWTYMFNFLLALFNLLPAKPLDGYFVWTAIPELFKDSKYKIVSRLGIFLEYLINERTLNSITMIIWWIILGSIIYSMF